jgi:hypothetical protein
MGSTGLRLIILAARSQIAGLHPADSQSALSAASPDGRD